MRRRGRARKRSRSCWRSGLHNPMWRPACVPCQLFRLSRPLHSRFRARAWAPPRGLRSRRTRDRRKPLVAPRPVVRPLAPQRYEIRFTASAETRERLRRAQDLLGHAVPSGDVAQVIDRALIVLVAELERRKFAATPHPRRSAGQSDDSRNIPAEVRRTVAARDGDRCAFVATNGRRCDERRFLEFHHVVPYGAGGKATVENIQLRCRAHNGYEAERFYGPGLRRARVLTRSGTSIATSTATSTAKGGAAIPGLSP